MSFYLTGTGGGSVAAFQETLAVTGGQPDPLSTTPLSDAAIELFVNGEFQTQPNDYTASGSALTWVSGDFSLDGSDEVIAHYITATGVTANQEGLAVTGGQPDPLSTTPIAPESVRLYVNGSLSNNPNDYTISGSAITWVSGDFSLDGSDEVTAVYLS